MYFYYNNICMSNVKNRSISIIIIWIIFGLFEWHNINLIVINYLLFSFFIIKVQFNSTTESSYFFQLHRCFLEWHKLI